MIAEYFQPSLKVNWDEWARLMGYIDGMSVWPASGLIRFAMNVYKILHIELFDYQAFITRGAQYLLDCFGSETGQWQIDHSNIAKEQSLSAELLKMKIIERREPTIDDRRRLLGDRFLI